MGRPHLARLLTAAAVATVLITTGADGARAATAYGPPAPHVPIPGGYFRVCTSQTVGQAGGVIGPLPCGRLRVTVAVPRGAFPVRLQVTLTAPNLPAIRNAGIPGYHVVGGVGVTVTRNGHTYKPFFNKLVHLRMVSCAINWSSIVVAWYGTHWVRWTQAHVRRCVATLGFDMAEPDWAVLSPGGPPSGGTSLDTHPGSGSATAPGGTAGGPGDTTGARHPSVTAVRGGTGERSAVSPERGGPGAGSGGPGTGVARTAPQAGRGKARSVALAGANATLLPGPLLTSVLVAAALVLAAAGSLFYLRRRRAGGHRVSGH